MSQRIREDLLMDFVIYTTYSTETDMTFILLDTLKDNKVISTEVKGFYFGGEDSSKTKEYYGKLKADFI
jgi:hypothetical protein